MTDPATLAVALVAAHRGLISAHDYAETFHANMSLALTYADEIADIESDPESDPAWLRAAQDSYATALGQAGAALQKMPVKWQAILTIDIKGD